MAKVMISVPDDLLDRLDAEARRRHTSRSALLQSAARQELGLPRRPQQELLAALDSLSSPWDDPSDVVELIRADRSRDG
jgi:predicted transcriptional regulator